MGFPIDDVPVEKVREFESSLYSYMDSSHPEILNEITEKQILDGDLEEKMRAAVRDFKQTFS